MTFNRLIAAAVLTAPCVMASPAAFAASSYDACTGFIPSLPATITTQGVWCLDKDLSSALGSGAAITVANNNVTIDCNGFKLGGLAAGPSTTASGIYANGRSNVTVRDCNIRGFAIGVSIDGSSSTGHRVERNRFDGNTTAGVAVFGTASVIRDNLVSDTGGGETDAPYTVGILGQGHVDVIDNRIVNVDGAASGTAAIGILYGSPDGASVRGNRIVGLFPGMTAPAFGIAVMSNGFLDIRSNSFVNIPGLIGGSAYCAGPDQVLYDNFLQMGPPSGCWDGGDNYGIPEVGP